MVWRRDAHVALVFLIFVSGSFLGCTTTLSEGGPTVDYCTLTS